MSRPTSLTAARRTVRRLRDRIRWEGSQTFWEKHYSAGGNSGAGSSGRLAEFKADVLNHLVSTNQIERVIEFGCGDGNQLARIKYPHYLGLDVSSTAIRRCREKFIGDSTKAFICYEPALWIPRDWIQADAAVSLDVIYHLVEDASFELYMTHLFNAAKRFVVIYSSNSAQPHPEVYTRPRAFMSWVERNAPPWKLIQHIPNVYPYDPALPNETSLSDFWIFARR